MPLVDPRTDQLVVRIVYDGPAYAGKTTSLRALAESLGGEMFSAGEADGRTLYFDWVDYLGGRFEGQPIRCQIVAVPGQEVLVQRRRLLLATADAAVFVADSRRSALSENRRAFDLLREVMAGARPPFGVVAQANKRDLPDIVGLDELRGALLDGGSLAMTESVAERNEGVRETFVLAVRLALDRVREMGAARMLPRLAPEIADGPALLEVMRAVEEGAAAAPARVFLGFGGPDRRAALGEVGAARQGAGPGSPAAPAASVGTRARLASTSPAAPAASAAPARGAPQLPETAVPPGLIWPPVSGRVVLHEAMRRPPELEQTKQGDWLAASPQWALRSSLEALFFDLDAGRRALVSWARWHTAAGSRLSVQRCVVLARVTPLRPYAANRASSQDGGAWRLWQIIARARTLADDCEALFAQADDNALGTGLLRAAELRLRAERELRASGWLHRLDMRSLAATPEGNPVYTWFAPFPAEVPAAADAAPIDVASILRADLGPLLRGELARSPRRLPGLLDGLRRAAAGRGLVELGGLVQRLLLES
jgi:signal recognition particle receptor subunit beta